MENPRMAMAKQCPDKAAASRQGRPNPGRPDLGKQGLGLRQSALLAMVALAVAGCGKDNWFSSPESAGKIDYLKGFTGGVAADEPRAALVAQQILSAGGSAADAAAAAAFVYTVTYPAGAGLGSGGVCLVSDPVRKRAETIEFPSLAPKDGGPVAIPAMARGLSLLQGRYGKLRWEAVVTPAEQLARFGEPASRAFVQAAVEAQPPVTQSPGLLPIWGTRTGMVPQEGERRQQFALGNVLARLRTHGAADLYQGALSQSLLADMAAAGSRITADELRDYVAGIGKPIEVPYENSITIFTSNTAAGGAVAAWLLEQTFDGTSLFSGTSVKSDKFAESLGQAYRSDPATLQMNGFGSASISVIDRQGSAVSCAFSMGTAFGARRTGRETGILFANVPGVAGDEAPYLTAMVGYNKPNNQSFLAVGGSGGAPAAAAAAYSVLQAALHKSKTDPATVAITEPRLFQANPQSTLLVEPKTNPALYKAVTGRGITVNETGRLGRVTMTYCFSGLPRDPSSCSFAADPRGYGLATGRQF
jgi:gamma-glutamyltranspeptidase/glutathione hydrolase